MYVWENDKEFAQEEKKILASLSPYLQAEVCYSVYGRVLHSAPFFAWVFNNNESALKSLALRCDSLFFVRGDVVFDYDQVHTKIYFLLCGCLQVNMPSHHDMPTSGRASG